MKIKTTKTRIFTEGEDLVAFIRKYIKRLPENAVLVITSKIVSLSESRMVLIDRTLPHDVMRERIIKSECDYMIRTPFTWLTIKDNMVMSSAGIDESNADGKIILLPADSYKTAAAIRRKLKKLYGVRNLGVLITDSRLLPLRAGVVGVALGYAGFCGVRDYRGRPDLFGRTLELTRTDVADALATASVLLMGEGSECQPLAVVTNAPIVFSDRVSRSELYIDPTEDIYVAFFRDPNAFKAYFKKSSLVRRRKK